jgi:precorrin-6Y C5,15-methyltransferase (decarboxylating)
VFSGTTEGRKLVGLLSGQSVSVTVCVATEYGEQLVSPAENVTVSARRLNEEEMTEMLSRNGFDLVIDATHPYARAVSENLIRACRRTATEYLRLERDRSRLTQSVISVPDAAAAAEYLRETSGAILLTTGSKELSAFQEIPDFSERVFARVLPVEESIAACREAGLSPAHILAVQGPFSEEMNEAQLKHVNAAYLVTKDGGSAGGFEEKSAAAQKCGAAVVLISRPAELSGLSLREVAELLRDRYGVRVIPQVALVGIGPGAREMMTPAAQKAIDCAECVIGAKRMIQAAAHSRQASFAAISPAEIAEWINTHGEFTRFAVVFSGDIGFYSGAKKLLPYLKDCAVEFYPGISSLAYLCAKLRTSYEDVYPLSLHGRSGSVAQAVRRHPKVFALVGGTDGVKQLCGTLCASSLSAVRVSVGQRLSYPEETVTVGTAESLSEMDFDALSAVLIENDAADEIVSPGLADELFVREMGEKPIPMTKSEVRAVCLSKLKLTPGAVCWDIGAGTGAVSIELGRLWGSGTVYAGELKDAALQLLRRNREQFAADNMEIVAGRAPEACAALPAPTHAFLGGSSGNLREIVELLLAKNPGVRIVATAISLETVSELTACAKEFGFAETEVVSMTVAKNRQAGPYNMMTGQNPVYIFTLQAGGAS